MKTAYLLLLLAAPAWAGDSIPVFGPYPEKLRWLEPSTPKRDERSFMLAANYKDRRSGKVVVVQDFFLEWPLTECRKENDWRYIQWTKDDMCWALTPPANLVHMEFMDNRGRKWRAKWEPVSP